ncbi:hypothetical protein [Micromonospora sp. ATA51]|uniref:hypothetical protein n=1 Tax=Micromonospora sp. ATA51 TaxID=2806098 RepID=UPI001A53DB95|nr:hypothetical protein [Micromonospora sp. ATA51]MBM0226120.1 hypothetical protein [Micromonospora sp. ATA51]
MSSYKTPSKADVQAVLLKIPTFQLRRVFYEGLKNPRWVRPLFEAGAFTNPPEPENTDDGYIRDVYWPEISYLTRVASEASTDVVDVLLSLANSNNAWVRRAAFEIGSKIPAAEGARLKPLLQAWTTTPGGFGWRTDPRELVSFAITLLEGGEIKTGRWLANNLFAPKPSVSDDPFRRKQFLHWTTTGTRRSCHAWCQRSVRTHSRQLPAGSPTLRSSPATPGTSTTSAA